MDFEDTPAEAAFRAEARTFVAAQGPDPSVYEQDWPPRVIDDERDARLPTAGQLHDFDSIGRMHNPVESTEVVLPPNRAESSRRFNEGFERPGSGRGPRYGVRFNAMTPQIATCAPSARGGWGPVECFGIDSN